MAKVKKVDRRVKYTKMVLKESFIDLLEKKDISQITIKEICENADINRATFYSHYTDQYDLMKKIQNELFDNIEEYLSAFTHDVMNAVPVELVEKILDYIKKNARLCRLLLSERGDLGFQKRVLALIYDKNIRTLTKGGTLSKEDAQYIHSFMLTGCIGVIQKWFDDNMKKSTHFMAALIINLATSLQENAVFKI